MDGSLLVVVIPFRSREAHLARLLPALTAHLAGRAHRLVVVEQAGTERFNKGRLLNAGFQLERSEGAYYCFHDVDMIPEGPACDYAPPSDPTLIAKYCSQFDYRLPYPSYFGGVTLFPEEAFTTVNGFSNEYWGWGCEDDDMMNRLRHHGYAGTHREGRYTSLPHPLQMDPPSWRRNARRVRRPYRYADDGLRSLRFGLLESTPKAGYHHYLLDVGRPSLTPGSSEHALSREAVLRQLRHGGGSAAAKPPEKSR